MWVDLDLFHSTVKLLILWLPYLNNFLEEISVGMSGERKSTYQVDS